MDETYGAELRRLRKEAGLTMGAVARHVGVSVSYLSDVELGNRKPFPAETTRQIAELLNADPEPLIMKAGMRRGYIQIEPRTPMALEVGATLARRFSELSDDDLAKIKEILGDSSGRGR